MKNSTCRKLLEKRYGKGCFMERAGIRKITPEQEKEMKRTIKGYKKLDRTITYHHIKEKCKGGEVSIENGANLAAYNHAWLHQQDETTKEQINKQLQDFKLSIDVAGLEVNENGVEITDNRHVDFDMSDTISIPLYDAPVHTKRNKFNRAKNKRETQKMWEEYKREESER